MTTKIFPTKWVKVINGKIIGNTHYEKDNTEGWVEVVYLSNKKKNFTKEILYKDPNANVVYATHIPKQSSANTVQVSIKNS